MKVVFGQLSGDNLETAHEIEKSSLENAWSISELSKLIGDTDRYYIVAYADGCPAGTGGCYFISGECHIMNIAVLQEYRGLGIGHAIITNLLEYAKSKGSIRVLLEMAEDNHAAFGLYKKAGFKITGRRKNYYKNKDAILMDLYL